MAYHWAFPTILERKACAYGCLKGNFYYWEKSGTGFLGFCTQMKLDPRTRPAFGREVCKIIILILMIAAVTVPYDNYFKK